jgi:hypothetical protein
MDQIIGRIEEKAILNRKLATADPELIAIYGRRRVGKTYLIRTYLNDKMIFELTGGYYGQSLPAFQRKVYHLQRSWDS